jgi:signal transduction histidine kinase
VFVRLVSISSTSVPMRLADFILENLDQILQSWEDFASTITPAATNMNSVELRDHAEQMLRTIAEDLRMSQTAEESVRKSKGSGARGAEDTAAELHALTRLTSGFTIEQMVSEYRALRASVLLLWSQRIKQGVEFELEEMTRFNEAIDQSLAESVVRFAKSVSESQQIFLGILGHDLRTPLGAISIGAEVLLHTPELDSKHSRVASRIYASVGRAKSIVDSLLDFTRSHFGGGIPIQYAKVNLTVVCAEMVEEVRTYHPDRSILFNADEVTGDFDKERLEQVFCNLMENAVQHGDEVAPVCVSLNSSGGEVCFSVRNEGEAIPKDAIPQLFKPLKEFSACAASNPYLGSGLGLGLYIAHEIVAAHNGRIDVVSTPTHGTTFSVTLPLNAGRP